MSVASIRCDGSKEGVRAPVMQGFEDVVSIECDMPAPSRCLDRRQDVPRTFPSRNPSFKEGHDCFRPSVSATLLCRRRHRALESEGALLLPLPSRHEASSRPQHETVFAPGHLDVMDTPAYAVESRDVTYRSSMGVVIKFSEIILENLC